MTPWDFFLLIGGWVMVVAFLLIMVLIVVFVVYGAVKGSVRQAKGPTREIFLRDAGHHVSETYTEASPRGMWKRDGFMAGAVWSWNYLRKR
jgi:uncharacterized membrane protein